MIVRLGGALERDLNELLQAARKRGRKHAGADNDAGVAVARLLARTAPVDQRDRQTAFGKVQRDRCADNAGAQNDCIGTCHAAPQKRNPWSRGTLYITPARWSYRL